MNVLSLFDGISCGRLALERCGIKVDKYFASEIDKYAIKVSEKHYPDIIRLGDVNNFDQWDLPKIDLLIGGSPCQDLSCANMVNLGLKGSKSGLFYRFVDCLNKFKPKYFFLENVASMSKKDRDTISEILGVQPILVNSKLVVQQSRNRYYWTNIPFYGIEQKEYKEILGDEIKLLNQPPSFTKKLNPMIKKLGYIPDKFLLVQGKPIGDIYPTITTWSYKPNGRATTIIKEKDGFRVLTPLECERLQTLPDNYTDCISSTRRYIAIGNCWTVDIITEFFKNLK